VALWFAGLAMAAVWAVFRDPAVDYRLVAAGALLPDAVDLAFGGTGPLHALPSSAALLVVVMVATRGRRGLRRRLLALPIGTFLHLAIDGVWTRTAVFWWPLAGLSLERGGLPSLSRPLPVLVLQELAGAAALAWWWHRFALADRRRRAAFLRTGRVGRDLRGP